MDAEYSACRLFKMGFFDCQFFSSSIDFSSVGELNIRMIPSEPRIVMPTAVAVFADENRFAIDRFFIQQLDDPLADRLGFGFDQSVVFIRDTSAILDL